VTFATTREAYDAYMGRYANRLAPLLIAFAEVQPAESVLDVGCGPGSLSEALGAHVGAEQVSAIDPSEQFAAATAERVPGADVQVGVAELLPWPAEMFDAALAQLVVNFMWTQMRVSARCDGSSAQAAPLPRARGITPVG